MDGIRKKFGTYVELDLAGLPARAERRNPVGIGLFLMAFGIIFGGLPLSAMILVGTGEKGAPAEAIGTVILFSVIGVGIFILGLAKFTWRIDIRVSGGEIIVKEKRLTGPRVFTEPLSAYRGVLLRKEYRNRRWLDAIELAHNDTAKTVLLAQYLDTMVPYDMVRKSWEGYAKLLNLPALELTTEGETSRAPSGLDCAPAQPVSAAGTLPPVAESGPLRPPASIKVERGVGTTSYVIAHNLKDLVPASFVLLVSFALLGAGAGLSGSHGSRGVILTVSGAVLCAYTVFSLAGIILARQVLVLGNGTVRMRYRWPFGETKGKTMPMREIESVDIDRAVNRMRKSVMIKSDRMALSAGYGLNEEALVWLRARIIETMGSGL